MRTPGKYFFIPLLSLFTVSLLLTAFTPLGQTLGARIAFTVANWDDMTSETDLSPDNIHSWIPEVGVRGRYEIAKSVLGKHTLEGIVGEPVFLSGPHSGEMDFTSKTEFGYYNPAFITGLHEMLAGIFSNRKLVKKTQKFYNLHCRTYLRTYYLAYDAGANNETVMEGYMSSLSNYDAKSNSDYPAHSEYLQEAFRDFAEGLEAAGYDVYEGFNCPGFWVRRSLDGTTDEFYALLRWTLETFDADFLN
jgi:hypothetical protein